MEKLAAVSLDDAPVAVAAHENVIITAMGTGCKNLIRKERKALVPQSTFHHDVQVSTSYEQSSVAVAPNGSRLAVASDEGHLTILKLPHYELMISKHLHTQGIIDLCFSADGTLVATTARDRAAYLCKTDSLEIVQRISPVMPEALHTHIRAIRFATADPLVLFTVESSPRKGGWIAVWRSSNQDRSNWTPISSLKASKDAVTTMAVSSTTEFLALSTTEGHVIVFTWNGNNLSRVWSTEASIRSFGPTITPHVLPVTAIRFTKSSEHFLTASADYTVALWSTHRKRNWIITSRILLWFIGVIVLLFAILVAEDEHLHHGLRRSRDRIKPHLDPFASEAQKRMRPFIRRGSATFQPYTERMMEMSHAKLVYARKKAQPVLRHWENFAMLLRQLSEHAQRSFGLLVKRHSKPVKGSNDDLVTAVSPLDAKRQVTKEGHAGLVSNELKDSQAVEDEDEDSEYKSR